MTAGPRIQPISPPFSAEFTAEMTRLMPTGMEPLLLFRVVATSPRAWRKLRGGSLLDSGPLTIRQRELVILRTCALGGSEYEWGVHVTVFGERAGLVAAEIAATVHHGSAASCWSDDEAALLASVEALHARCTLTDQEFARVAAVLDPTQLLEVLQLAGVYRTIAYLANALALPLETGMACFPSEVST